jgi:hypothetical protein
MIRWMHAYNQVKMIGHDTKTQHIHKIEAAEPQYQIQQIVLFSVFKRKPGQGCTGDDVVDGRDVSADEPGYTGHEAHLAAKGPKAEDGRNGLGEEPGKAETA